MSDNLDRVLNAAGGAWRADQPPPPDVDTSRFLRSTHGPRARVWAPIAAVAGVAAVLAVVVLPIAFGGGGGGAPLGAEPSGPPEPAATPVRPAAPMEGFGTLLREADGTMKLCRDVAVLTSLPPAGAGCSRVFVLVTGVGDEWFTQEATSGQRWSEPVRVEGSYGAGTLAVTKVEAAVPDPPTFVEPPVPCPEPPAGWAPGYGVPAGQDQFTTFNVLAEHVRANPDRFTDVWEGHPDGPPKGEATDYRAVYVVGTTGDVDQARAELTAMYPGNLCVHQVAYSWTKLTEIADQLQSVSSTPIQAEALVIENKVRVSVVALDPPTSAILDAVGRDALIIDEPLLKWLE
jgi:hypothetical protein